uniref:SMB domain-containing protein n=1 Tax=Alexandrium catenella TaxID=2925 RepID=A0A7S1RKL3_ALECA|mmetsp:Transcript_62315/g.166610  ORF Transcript_62315/g.166610 Transcript_62315/m.166610 type:complete len:455 (+) Transcript_62315:84-1448(+)
MLREVRPLLLTALASVVPQALVAAAPLTASSESLPSFDAYVRLFNKSYTLEELPRRRRLYESALREIEAINSRPGTLWKAGVNRFTDAAPEERPRRRSPGARPTRRQRAGLVPSGLPAVGNWSESGNATAEGNLSEVSPSLGSFRLLPKSVDWRWASGPIKNEAQCGACWAIAPASTLESHVFLATKTRIDVSEQAVTDCTYSSGNTCNTGGTLEDAFAAVVKRGIADAGSYPFVSARTGHSGRCLLGHGVAPVAGITGYVEVEANNPRALMEAVATVGPVAVGVDASKHWDYYQGGILDSCDDHHMVMDHDVVLVGYGEANGVKYWLVQNGWGADWGEGGFIRIKRRDRPVCGHDSKEKGAIDCGQCGILTDPVYPTGVHLRRHGGGHHHHHHHGGQDRHGGGSCAAYGCAGYAPSHGCQCNRRCEKFGNCCHDYRQRCHHRRLSSWVGPVLV